MFDLFKKKSSYFLYRYRYLTVYVLVGFLSLLVELSVFKLLISLNVTGFLARTAGVPLGILSAYFLNARFNFKVPRGKRRTGLLIFALISTGSFIFNSIVNAEFVRLSWSYEEARLTTSGLLFFIAYIFHRRFTFVDAKQVGVAVYVNQIEDIQGIREKVGLFPDFIHIDVIDQTFNPKAKNLSVHRIEVAYAYWPKMQLHTHLMTRFPSKYLSSVLPFSDVVFVHFECDENLCEIFKIIRTYRKKVGLCLMMQSKLDAIKPFVSGLDILMLLAIEKPGYSGQAMDLSVIERIAEIQQWPERDQFELCVDGGVNERTIGLLNVEKVVSGSSVINHSNPTQQIIRLQTSSNYEST